MKKYNTVTLIGTIAFLFVVIVYATYAYVNPVTDLKDLNIAADISSPLAFTATGGNNFNLLVDVESMTPDKANNVVAESTDNIVISLDTDGQEGICCSYTIDWVWDETDIVANQYSISEGATNEYVLTGSMSETYLASDGITNSVLHANPKFNSQIPNYNASSLSTTMYSGQICNNTRTLTTHAEQKYTLNASFYNMPVVQDKFKGVSLSGSVKVANVSCIRNDNEHLPGGSTLSETVLALADGSERQSSQADGGVYRVINPEVIVPTPTTYTPLTQSEYGKTIEYKSSGNAYLPSEGTSVSGMYEFNIDTNTWSNNASNMTTWTSYNMVVPVQQDGSYQICYRISEPGDNGYFQVWISDSKMSVAGTYVFNTSLKTANAVYTCSDLGYLTTNLSMRVVSSNDTQNIAEFTFYLQKNTETATYGTSGTRYQGKDPDNYVQFNENEKWRIIGTFDGKDIGLESGKKYTKLIRADSLEPTAWDFYGQNDWTISELNTYLNGSYLSEMDFTSKEMIISNATYHLGSIPYENHQFNTPSQLYMLERGNVGGGASPDRLSHQNYLGLMYPSDYGYAMYAGNQKAYCTTNISILHYARYTKYLSCSEYDWLSLNENDWLISPSSTAPYDVTLLGIYGNFGFEFVGADLNNFEFGDIYSFRPVLYLKSDVIITGGDGSKDNPYTIASGDKQTPEFYICYQQYAGTEECKNHHPEYTIEASGLGMTYGYYYTGDGEVSLSCEGDECTRGVAMELDSLNNKFTLAGANNGLAYSANFNLVVNTSETNEFKSGTFVYEAIHRYDEEL